MHSRAYVSGNRTSTRRGSYYIPAKPNIETQTCLDILDISLPIAQTNVNAGTEFHKINDEIAAETNIDDSEASKSFKIYATNQIQKKNNTYMPQAE